MAAETKWYYVEKQERKGPVSFENLQQLVAKGTIVAETLVWKEGMQDWERASKIRALINPKPDTLPAVTIDPNRSNASSGKNSPSITPKATSTPAAVRVAPPANAVPTQETTGAPGSELEFGDVDSITTTSNSTTSTSETVMNHLILKLQPIGYPCLIIGFLLVISGKGCDSLGSRWVKGATVAADLAKNKFEAAYAAKENAFQAQINDLNDSGNPNLDRIKSLNEKISELNKNRNAERRELQASTWATLNSNATMALDRYHSWGFTRELIFVFGSMVLSVGLLVVGITGEGSEKWVCLIMLAIITFSIYVGGFAWSASLQSVIPTFR